MICPACGAENRAEARFCDACGAVLPSEPERELRKVVTVLFCDVTGSTALGERLDPEALRTVMASHFAVARAAIERHGGTVEKFIGDAVMAVFGVPIVREDDALRAVRAAVELRDAVQLDVRIGVNTGEVVTGSGETLVTGDAVNVAARLEQAAGLGEVLIGEATYALVRDAVVAEQAAPIHAKGKSQPLVAYRLSAVTGDAPFARRGDVALVGRERERRLLTDAWERAQSERACAQFTILGSAGVGKTRLTQEFLAGLDATVLRGRCLSYGEGITYWPVVEVVLQLLGDASPPNPTIAALLGDGSAAADEIAFAVRKLFETSARERPLVVLFDDLQWAEPTFLDLIEHITDWSRDAPLLMLCLARPDLLDLRPAWGGGKLNATTVLLEPLSEGETDELIERLLGAVELDAALRARIQAAAEGNPLFVEQMLAMVQDAPGAAVAVPPTIQALLAARLDQLPRGERAALERGSVEGQVFHRGAVQALTPGEASVPGQLMGLVRKELVRPATATVPDDDAFRFRHLLIRDAAYDGLAKATRAELHEQFATWLEVRGAGLVELDEVLGYHLEQAARYRSELGELGSGDLGSRAAARLVAAGTRAIMRADFGACHNLLRRAVAIAPEDAPERFRALPWLGVALYVRGELAESDRILTEAVERGDAEDSAIAFFIRAQNRAHTGSGGDSLDAHESGVRELLVRIESDGGSDLALTEGYLALSRILFWQGRLEAQLAAAERARVHAVRTGESVLEWLAIASVVSAMHQGTTPWPDYEVFVRSILDESDRIGRHATNLIAGLGVAAANRERFGDAASLFEQCEAELVERGDTFGLLAIVQGKGGSERLAGELEAAEKTFRGGWDGLGALGERGFRSTVGCELATVLVDLGRVDEAERIVEEAAGIAAADDWFTSASSASARARIASARGEHGDAIECARRSVEIAGRREYVLAQIYLWCELSAVLVAAGRAAEANEAIAETIRLARLKGSTAYEARARGLLASCTLHE